MSFALTPLRLRFLLVPLVALAAGCHDRVYDFGGVLKPFDAAVATTDGSTFEATPLPDSGYDVSGAGGAAGDAGVAGHAGSGGAAGTNVQLCDDKAAERLTDPFNCGKCLHSCAAPNSTPSCNNGTCAITCVADFVDADKNVANGCECEPSNGGVEICDGLDNNCNGMTDEGFDFQTDVANCGVCNKACTYPFATASCVMGVCQQGACLPGYYDRDPNVPGCETACTKTNGGVEICDGLDNDCNGLIDDNVGAATITCKSLGVCAGTTPTCAGANGWV
ncbi:MAG TPA: MopE-related protein, partial [Polyangia bacterium]|nr:MopE-related protein [Polyangia bacterium]